MCLGFFKATYYPNSSFTKSCLGGSPNYAWRSIWGANSILLNSCLWRVGNGTSISILNDPWLVSDKRRFVSTIPLDGVLVEHVSDLINPETCYWHKDLIKNMFNVADIKAIMSIPLSTRLYSDEFTWAYDKDGIYSVNIERIKIKITNTVS